MQIQQIKLSDIKPYEKNNRKHPKEQIEKLSKQIEAHGFDVPIVVDANNIIVKGHGRLAAAKKLKLKTVPVIVRSDLTEAQCAAARLADNKLSELAEIDMSAIQAELDALKEINFDLDLTAFDSWSPFREDPATEGLTDPDDAPEVSKESPITKRGDTWILGNHRLRCGDSTDSGDVALLMNGEKADMCFTSPPYNAGVSSKLSGNTSIDDNFYQEEYNDDNDDQTYLDFLNKTTNNAIQNASYIFWNIQYLAGNRTVLPEWWSNFKKFNVDVAIWDKGHAAPQQAARVLNSVFEFIFIFTSEQNPCRAIRIAPEFRGTVDNIFRIPPQRKNEYAAIHAATFPVEFPKTFLEKFCPKNGSALELFCGTGTTLIACEQTNRRCYAMELSPTYCDVIVKRWQQFTGKKAIREDGSEFDSLSPQATA